MKRSFSRRGIFLGGGQRLAVLVVLSAMACRGSAKEDSPPRFTVTPSPTARTSQQALRPEAPRAQVLEHGVFEAVRPGRIAKHEASSTGQWIRGAVLRHVERTDSIPARLGTIFGLQFRISGLDPELRRVRVWRVLRHPPFHTPDGAVVSKADYPLVLAVVGGVATGVTGYAFNEEYERVEGTWSFELWYEGEPLLQQRFVTHRPGSAPAPVTAPASAPPRL